MGPVYALRPVPFYMVCVGYSLWVFSSRSYFLPLCLPVLPNLAKSVLYFADCLAARLLYMDSIHQRGGTRKAKTILSLLLCLEPRCGEFVRRYLQRLVGPSGVLEDAPR